MKSDLYFGDVAVYHEDVFASLPIARATPEAMELALEVS
jgi:hypothetical protein